MAYPNYWGLAHQINGRIIVFCLQKDMPEMQATAAKRIDVRDEARRELREKQREWLRGVAERTGKSPSAIAKAAGVAELTLTRFLNRADYTGVLSPVTVRMICEAEQDPGPDFFQGSMVMGSVMKPPQSKAPRREFNEGRPIELDHHDNAAPIIKAIRALVGPRHTGVTVFELLAHSLEGVGYLPGDVLVVDSTVEPAADSPVCAMRVESGSQPATIFRLYHSPILLGATYNPQEAPRPLFVDNVGVKIMGTITHVIRARSTN